MKKGLAVVLTLFLILIAFSDASASDISATKRHVAMVYDDSTSMYVSDITDEPVLNWAYANYMTQAFLALLNPQDSFYVTYMSDTEKENVEYENLLSLPRKQAIADIKNKNDRINKTPFEAVEAAYLRLRSLEEAINDEYWLVVVTDGGFTGYEGDVSQTLLGYIDEMAALGKTLKVVFLAIGEGANPPEADEEKGLLVYKSGTEDIVSTMSALADNISGRHNVTGSRISKLSGNRLSVDMLLPVRSLIVFDQADGNRLTDITNNKKDGMQIEYEYDIQAPDAFEYSAKVTAITDPDARGAITRINPQEEGTILSDGRYILSFQNEVDLNNVRVMYEPAIDIAVRYKQDGKYVKNPKDGTVTDVEVVLTDALTGEPLNSRVMPAEVQCSIQIVSDGNTVMTSNGFLAEAVELKSGNTSINTEITMPGYFTLRKRTDYVYIDEPEETAATAPPEYDDSKGPWPPEVKLTVERTEGLTIDLKSMEEAEPFIVTPYFNGEKGTVSDLQMGDLQLIYSRKIDFEVVIDEQQMVFLISPKYSGGLYGTSTGNINLDVYFQSEYGKVAQAKIAFIVKDLSWIERNYRVIVIPFAAAIIVILILGIMVIRPKFADGAWLEFTQMQKNTTGDWVAAKAPASTSLNDLKGPWRMIPFVPERVHISNIIFMPAPDNQYIKIPKKSLNTNMGTARGMFGRGDIKNDYYLQNGFKFYLEHGDDTRIEFVYHGPKKTLLTKKTKKKGK